MREEGTRRQRVAIVVLSCLLGVAVISPAGAHITKKAAHNWTKHYLPLALDTFYSEAEADARFLEAAEAPAAVMAADGSGSGLDADLLDGFDTATTGGADRIYVSDAQGDLPANTVDDAAIENITRTVAIMAHELDPGFTSGVPPTQVLVGAAPALSFDPNTDQTISMATRIPDDVAGTVLFTVVLFWSTAGASGSAVWDTQVRSVGTGEQVDTGGVTNGSSLTDATTGADLLNPTTGFGTSSAAMAPGDLLILTVTRDADVASDTLAATARLHHVTVTYTATR